VTPPAWSDVEADLQPAFGQTEGAVGRAAGLSQRQGDDREAHELATGKHLHDAYCAAERAIERLVELVDGNLPVGRHDHQDLIARAARRVEGLRPPLISAETAGELTQLLKFRHAFRHSYGTFQFAKAAPNLPLAARAIPRLRDELTTFARATGFLPGA
jgi:hypothetical protein